MRQHRHNLGCWATKCTTTFFSISRRIFIKDSPSLRKLNLYYRRFQWPRVLRRRPTPSRFWDCGFESRRGHWCFSVVSVVCYQVERSLASGWSLVQRSLTGRDREVSKMGRPWTSTGCCAIEGSGGNLYYLFPNLITALVEQEDAKWLLRKSVAGAGQWGREALPSSVLVISICLLCWSQYWFYLFQTIFHVW
jgi:hypothetical protein